MTVEEFYAAVGGDYEGYWAGCAVKSGSESSLSNFCLIPAMRNCVKP